MRGPEMGQQINNLVSDLIGCFQLKEKNKCCSRYIICVINDMIKTLGLLFFKELHASRLKELDDVMTNVLISDPTYVNESIHNQIKFYLKQE